MSKSSTVPQNVISYNSATRRRSHSFLLFFCKLNHPCITLSLAIFSYFPRCTSRITVIIHHLPYWQGKQSTTERMISSGVLSWNDCYTRQDSFLCLLSLLLRLSRLLFSSINDGQWAFQSNILHFHYILIQPHYIHSTLSCYTMHSFINRSSSPISLRSSSSTSRLPVWWAVLKGRPFRSTSTYLILSIYVIFFFPLPSSTSGTILQTRAPFLIFFSVGQSSSRHHRRST